MIFALGQMLHFPLTRGGAVGSFCREQFTLQDKITIRRADRADVERTGAFQAREPASAAHDLPGSVIQQHQPALGSWREHRAHVPFDIASSRTAAALAEGRQSGAA